MSGLCPQPLDSNLRAKPEEIGLQNNDAESQCARIYDNALFILIALLYERYCDDRSATGAVRYFEQMKSERVMKTG